MQLRAIPGSPWFMPDYQMETDLIAEGHARVAGVDEVGRGPLAGPVTAAAVILDPGDIPAGLNDSKKLTARARAALEAEIKARAVWAVAHASVAEIDQHNILRASHIAMARAVSALSRAADALLIDGNMIPQVSRNRPRGGQGRRALRLDCGRVDPGQGGAGPDHGRTVTGPPRLWLGKQCRVPHQSPCRGAE